MIGAGGKLGIAPVILTVVVSVLLCCAPGHASATGKVDAYIKQQMAKHKVPGLSIAVVKNGKVLKVKGYGVSSIELGIPANENSVFQIYSTTKIFAGVAIMKLVEDGKLTLDTAVTEIIEGLPPAWKAIRVRHLLTHTSGLPEKQDNPRFDGLSDQKKRETPPEEWIPLVAEMPLKFHAGEKFSYHRSGYSLLGVIVEKLSRKTFAAFLEERVFTPLKMNSTQFGDSEVIVKRRPPAAYFRGNGELRHWVYAFGYGNPGAGLNSSAADLARFLGALDTGKVLRPESLQALWSPVKLNDGTEKGYGLGWTVDRHKGHKVVGHEGGGSAWVAHFPKEQLSVVVLCNLNNSKADEIQYGVADFYLEK